MKIGDIVHPTTMIPYSNKANMFEDELGTIVNIEARDDGHYLITVRRNRDGNIFKSFESDWEIA